MINTFASLRPFAGNLCWCLIVAFSSVATATGAEPKLDKTDLFSANTAGYKTYRVPGLVVTQKGTILTYCEARRGSRSDWADIEILMCRSTNGGKTWQPPQRIADSKKDTVHNAVAIVDQKSDRIHFLYCVNYKHCFYMYSDNDGVSFSKPKEITSAFKPFRKHYQWNVLATGPGHGLQLKNGRLVVPVWLSTAKRHHRPSAVSVIYSDDFGKNWKSGEIVCNNPKPLVNPSETIAAQLSDGRVMLNIRNENRNYRRGVSFSKDGATGWSKVEQVKNLYEPICMAAIIHFPKPFAENNKTFLFSNPNSENNPNLHGKSKFRYRENLTVKMSSDDCKNWPMSRRLQEGISGYSDLGIGKDGTIYCIYERGGDKGFAYNHLTMARFNREWIEQGLKDKKTPTK